MSTLTATITANAAPNAPAQVLHLRGSVEDERKAPQVDSKDQGEVLRLKGYKETNPVKYPRYLPVWEKKITPEIKEVPYVDPGTRGTPDKRHLLVGTTHKDLTPDFGTEVKAGRTGVQLSQLTKEGLDDLALYAAERGVLVFRDQDWKDLPIEVQAEKLSYFGRLHEHPTECHPEGYPQFRVVYRDPQDDTIFGNLRFGGERIESVSTIGWHVDHTAEIQPPGITFFWALETPPSGGDTVYASSELVYEKLSDDFKKRLEGLWVQHDNSLQINNSKNVDGPVRRQAVKVKHPLVRVHPVTGRKSLQVLGQLTHIVGWKKEESDYLLNFLNDLHKKSVDFQVRASYDDRTVVVWDNRTSAHTATRDWKGSARRHMVRAAAHADVPSPRWPGAGQ